jgi:hypothetical protein
MMKMFDYFPVYLCRGQQYVHRQETIDITVPLSHWVSSQLVLIGVSASHYRPSSLNCSHFREFIIT